MARLTGKEILAKVRKSNANTAVELLLNCKLTLKYVGSGKFRNVYSIVGSDYLVKVPIMTQGKRNVHKKSLAHAAAEYAMYRRILRYNKYLPIQALMPEIVGTTKGGTLVVRKYPRRLGRVTKEERKFLNEVDILTSEWMSGGCDLHDENLRRDKNGQIKIIDLGYFLANERFAT